MNLRYGDISETDKSYFYSASNTFDCIQHIILNILLHNMC